MGLTKTVTGFGSFSFSVCLSFLPFPSLTQAFDSLINILYKKLHLRACFQGLPTCNCHVSLPQQPGPSLRAPGLANMMATQGWTPALWVKDTEKRKPQRVHLGDGAIATAPSFGHTQKVKRLLWWGRGLRSPSILCPEHFRVYSSLPPCVRPLLHPHIQTLGELESPADLR